MSDKTVDVGPRRIVVKERNEDGSVIEQRKVKKKIDSVEREDGTDCEEQDFIDDYRVYGFDSYSVIDDDTVKWEMNTDKTYTVTYTVK